ncbi:MAG: ABC transporter permease [Clostridiales bacterium]|nr:ABC transporter permease [Clostridiales bacterium]
MKKNRFAAVLSPICMLLFSFLLAGLLILALGKSPLVAYGALFQGAFGSSTAWINTINKAVPICLAAFAVGICSKVGVFNIGVEGQLLFGALGSALAGIYITGLPAFLHIPLCISAGMLSGALWALIPTVLYIKRDANIIVSNILFNLVAKLVLIALVLGPFRGDNAMVPGTNRIQETAALPILVGGSAKLSSAVLLMLGVAILLYIYLNHTTNGFELRAVGLNHHAASYAGIPSKKYVFFALLAGGMLAGMIGAMEVQGTYLMLYNDFSPGYGFDGIPIALLAQGNPLVSIVGGLLFGGLRSGSQFMQIAVGVDKEIITVIQGLLVICIAAEPIFRRGINLAGRWLDRRIVAWKQ